MKHGLPVSTMAQIHGVLSRHPEVERVTLYGSRAKGNFKPGSDIDLTLSGTGLDERIRGRIDEELDDLLLPYQFDLSVFTSSTHADLIDRIRRVGMVFYERIPAETKC